MKLKNWKNKLIEMILIYESSKDVYDFRIFSTIRFYCPNISTGQIKITETHNKQSNFLDVS